MRVNVNPSKDTRFDTVVVRVTLAWLGVDYGPTDTVLLIGEGSRTNESVIDCTSNTSSRSADIEVGKTIGERRRPIGDWDGLKEHPFLRLRD